MTQYKKIVRFMINRNDGASQYDIHIDKALSEQPNNYSYIVKDINDYKSLPRALGLIFFWIRAQYIMFFSKIDIAIISPWMMLIYPKNISIISISHHYDPSVFNGIRKLYIKLSHWLFISQRSKVKVVVSCSKYWSQYYKKKGFQNTKTIFNGFDINSMDQSLVNLDNDLVLKRFNLTSKNYLHLGSYGPAKGQRTVIKCFRNSSLPMVATNSGKPSLDSNLKDIKFINASFEEYNVLLKNAKAVICMSEFKEGWCRVLHEAAIHRTLILGSGLGGMSELLDIGGFKTSSIKTLNEDFEDLIALPVQNNKFDLYRTFTLEKFCLSWRHCINKILDLN
jgi:glycosyltransferase involved in cell wall biosynthesis